MSGAVLLSAEWGWIVCNDLFRRLIDFWQRFSICFVRIQCLRHRINSSIRRVFHSFRREKCGSSTLPPVTNEIEWMNELDWTNERTRSIDCWKGFSHRCCVFSAVRCCTWCLPWCWARLARGKAFNKTTWSPRRYQRTEDMMTTTQTTWKQSTSPTTNYRHLKTIHFTYH